MYNTFFRAQFTESSSYNITCESNFASHECFHPLSIQKLLKTVKPSKAAGPDGIDGYVLKNCFCTLHIPLSIIFAKSYDSGSIQLKKGVMLMLYLLIKRR